MRALMMLMVMTSQVWAEPSADQQRNLAAAFLLVAAKQCAVSRSDPSIFETAIPLVRGELSASGVAEHDIVAIIDAARDAEEIANPAACAVYENALEGAAN